ncbi:hypothetical protein LTR48_004022 [Friedmanniomyces endolithicus]|uniref:Uncharacterized protein n=1 Tax=Rachicladosporium monterosium TaxID=1507873 RepID=A0ABR0L6J0_9PEZI|nr:hypothetical protein LTR48_004022 [Friedmanniomyces endolithicus]KAK5144271.1 hypothetical protein LTR32_003780 [Rachicladosporium monterosium]
MNVPERIQAICMVQFWSWIGWFPFLFYGSTWVGEIYLRHEDTPNPGGDALTEVGKAGSAAYLAFAIISFAASIILPWLVQSPDLDDKPGYTPRPPQGLESAVAIVRKNRPTLLTAWMLACLVFAASMVFAPWYIKIACGEDVTVDFACWDLPLRAGQAVLISGCHNVKGVLFCPMEAAMCLSGLM